MTIQCPGCGALVTPKDHRTLRATCEYCKSSIVLPSKRKNHKEKRTPNITKVAAKKKKILNSTGVIAKKKPTQNKTEVIARDRRQEIQRKGNSSKNKDLIVLLIGILSIIFLILIRNEMSSLFEEQEIVESEKNISSTKIQEKQENITPISEKPEPPREEDRKTATSVQSQYQNQDKSSQTVTSSREPKKQEPPKPLFETKILKIQEVTYIRTNGVKTDATEGALFVVITYRYKNISKQPIEYSKTPTYDEIYMENADGAKYYPDETFSYNVSYSLSLKKGEFNTQNPGIAYEDAAVFEILKKEWNRSQWYLKSNEGETLIQLK